MELSELIINEIKLTTLRGDLLNRLSLLDKDKTKVANPLPKNVDEHVEINENDEVIDRLSMRDRTELKSINDALKRLKHGIFGTCISCQKQITKKRLEAVPYSEKCILCEKDS
jgi:DnaK suppressor protein